MRCIVDRWRGLLVPTFQMLLATIFAGREIGQHVFRTRLDSETEPGTTQLTSQISPDFG